jgi:L-ascorbate metabolism protein UlaG (beta-lactamase superfamily)
MLLIVLSIPAAFVLVVWAYMKQPQFGKAPSGDRLVQIMQSPNFRDGAFQNLSFTPPLAEGASYSKVMRDFFFGKSKRSVPAVMIPALKTDLKNLDPKEDVLVWFGHSSYFMQIGGKKILVDPVFSGNASPLSFTTKSFSGSDRYTVHDMPDIDILFITHDHYDHLDHRTVAALRPKVRSVVTALGVGAHLEHWGYDAGIIVEKDWYEKIDLGDGFVAHTVPGRHFSGRGFKRNGTLWTGFVLKTPEKKIFIGGDSGYDTHFAKIGAEFGPFDLVLLENGQYNESWKYIHMMPEEVVQAAVDLGAKRLFPVHWSKFALSIHAWDEPIRRVTAAAAAINLPLLHPRIGELVQLDNIGASTTWWEEIQ